MKILFAIQGTGNGHISRAREILPHLQNYGEVDILISGTQADVQLAQPVAHRLRGFSFIFGKKGGVDYWKTFRSMNTFQLLRDIQNLPVHQYDLVINDFEPVTAWACKVQNKSSVALSHQASFLSDKTPHVQKYLNWQNWVLHHYAPATHHIGFHFKAYDDFIHTPVIRSEIRDLESMDMGHITVYLPAYNDLMLIQHFKQIKEVRWEVFSKHCKQAYQESNVSVYPVHNEKFNHSLSRAHALLTGGGFEGPAEALFLGKKLAMIPMKNQYEQQCNAEAARKMGVKVIYQIDNKFVAQLKKWINSKSILQPYFPDETSLVVADLMSQHYKQSLFQFEGNLHT